jgi:predicted dehydrogenase
MKRNVRKPELGVGVVGLGFMGRTHVAAYRAAAAAGHANRIVALCDRDLARLRGKRGPAGNLEKSGGDPLAGLEDARVYEEPAALLADEEVELVSVCTPTDSHVPLALAALASGKHVLVEKPVALRSKDVARLAAAAKRARRVCMPAMCMRFWPGWSWLAAAVKARTYGKVKSAVFRRLGSPPSWSKGFYTDTRKSGGALFDLHVHDADFVRFCFGAPESVASTGSLDHVTTLYHYERGPEHVVAEGGWNHTPGFPFFMGYTVVFERATAVFALGREPLLEVYRDGKGEGIALEPWTGYDGEVRHVLDVVSGKARLRATVAEAAELVRMLEAERRSLESGRVSPHARPPRVR